MSFRDFNDDGPGTFGWDYVLGHNTTGLFPDETHYIIDGDVLEEVVFTYAGGETWDTLIGNCWNITNISIEQDGCVLFDQDGSMFRAIPIKTFFRKDGLKVFDIKKL